MTVSEVFVFGPFLPQMHGKKSDAVPLGGFFQKIKDLSEQLSLIRDTPAGSSVRRGR
jgi:hypothetical protein